MKNNLFVTQHYEFLRFIYLNPIPRGGIPRNMPRPLIPGGAPNGLGPGPIGPLRGIPLPLPRPSNPPRFGGPENKQSNI